MVTSSWGQGEIGSYFIMKRVSIFQDGKTSGDGLWHWLHNLVNVLKMESCTLSMSSLNGMGGIISQ